ncbi:hemerythrin domain-containing protein [Chamaesiphon polymorphus]|uniref:DNA nickase n=1 Tax=Chamaesiphon polymorphus CCALA 037 TaxID=2107692 RepID=A0A2T1GF93_9CYAN|nr:hemerythrin domain-containing protein [Chamaesiphon polymorphus]PSB56166.1 DNA nickase [Chamaesiphon polymorphus CCALA 037]
MSITLDDSKRTAIACKLAGMKEVQNLLISNEEKLMSACDDREIRDRFGKMLDDDRKNLGVLDTVMVQYGVKSEPKETITEMVKKVEELMAGSELTVYEKAAQHELLKHQQFMAGVLVHKAAQVVGADVEAAIAPLNTINFENRAHQEQLKGVLESLGVRELTGQEADQGLWARVQDSIAAFSGIVGSAVTQTSDKSDMNVEDVIRADHNKVNMLFMQIDNTNDPQKIEEYFGQIYKDLSAHSEAEEEVVYPAVRPFYGDTQELYDEQAEMKQMLEEIKAMNPSDGNFKAKVETLKKAVTDHVRQEESEMFAAIRNNCSDDQREQMATQFKAAKSKIQEQSMARSN